MTLIVGPPCLGDGIFVTGVRRCTHGTRNSLTEVRRPKSRSMVSLSVREPGPGLSASAPLSGNVTQASTRKHGTQREAWRPVEFSQAGAARLQTVSLE